MNNMMFVKGVVAFVVLSSYNYVFASNNTSKTFKDAECQTVIDGTNISKYMSNTDGKTLNANCISKSNSIEEGINNMDNTNNMDNNKEKKVPYDPNIMWFDYQALFDKTKSVVLEENTNIKVEHTNFETNTLARTVLGIDSNYDELITQLINGNIKAQYELFDKIGTYMRDHFITDNNRYYIINYNYLNMMSIIAVLKDLENNHARNMYLERMISSGTIKKDFYMRNVNKISFYNVITPLINSGFYGFNE